MYWRVLAHIWSCCKAQVRLFIRWEQPARLWNISSSVLYLSSHDWGVSAAMNSSDSLVWANRTYFHGKQRLSPTGNFQELGRPGRAPPQLKPGGRSSRCCRPAGSIRLAVAKRQHMPTWLERKPAETARLREAHTRNTNSWRLFLLLPSAPWHGGRRLWLGRPLREQQQQLCQFSLVPLDSIYW